MGEMYQIIEELCTRKRITVAALSREVGISKSTMTELKKGRSRCLSAKNMDKVANFFGVSVDYLLGNGQKERPAAKSDEPDILDEVDIAFYGEYKELSDDEKDVVRDMVRVMRERRAKKQGR
ncbi:helix-turn-helix transcriptional regulator [Pygmaiobacter massiliensis]|uniref:helix-turn-helix domain-containing protein n=1 Tax=Pygmaiobacter massiliensis TaxID=1917873 RepID=UPI002A7F8889|nr:helix-turn-helix transcriptional regulator [Pygmaiobacter massiliensis]MDY4783923.1 helix-turn-helix transcriptional regulator [Pygmaiobacter massiliensis]